MAVSALRGALGFLTRLPVAVDEADWDAFRASPWAFPGSGYVVGALLALVFVPSLPAAATAAAFVVATYLVTGVNHADGLADLGDAAAVHGADRRREVLKDSVLGVGGTLALAVAVVALGFAAAAVAGLSPLRAVGVVVAAEVGAKLGMAVLACTGTAAHDGYGSQFTDTGTDAGGLGVAVLVALPVLVAGPGAVAVLGGPVAAFALRRWTRGWLGGVSGDVFGATNELGRLCGLLLGVVAWTL